MRGGSRPHWQGPSSATRAGSGLWSPHQRPERRWRADAASRRSTVGRVRTRSGTWPEDAATGGGAVTTRNDAETLTDDDSQLRLRLWIKECESAYLGSLHHQPGGKWCRWESDSYGQGTEGGRNSPHKERINATLAAAARDLVEVRRGHRHVPATALVLDGATAGTSRALVAEAGFPPDNIFVPNPYTHVVSSLNRDHKVSAFACRLEGYLQGRPRSLPGHAFVYLDLTASVQSHADEIAAAAGILDEEDSVLAITLSSRGMGDSWGRADAMHSAITGCMKAAASHGIKLEGLGAPWMGDYIIYDAPEPHDSEGEPASLADCLAARDLNGTAAALRRWSGSPEAQGAPAGLRIAAAKAAHAVLDGGRGPAAAVRGALWMPEAGRFLPRAGGGDGEVFAVLGWTGRDDDARAVLSLAQGVCGWRSKHHEHHNEQEHRHERGSTERSGGDEGHGHRAIAPAGATVLEGCAVLYVGQMMTIAFRASSSKATPSPPKSEDDQR